MIPHMELPKVSIIVLSHNALRYSKMMYASLRRYTRHPYELIWVDSASTDGTKEWLNSLDETKVFFVGKMGIGEAMLYGLTKCDSESKYIGDLDNDLILTDGWLGRLVKHMEDNPEFGAIATKSTAAFRGTVSFKPSEDNFDEDIQAFARKIVDENAGLARVSWVNGSHTLLRREAIEQVGLWDARLWMAEDKDLGLRLTEARWRSAYANNTWVYHFHARTTKGVDPEWNKKRRESLALCKRLIVERANKRRGKGT